MDYPKVSRAAELLRRHGVNAYDQADEVVLYWDDWQEVHRFYQMEDCSSYQQIADVVVQWLVDNIKGIHTHEL